MGTLSVHLKIWETRSNKGLSLRQLERMSGISKTTLNDLEDEKRSPTLNQLEKIAIALNVKISDLYDSEYK